jgi:hypothetical protein
MEATGIPERKTILQGIGLLFVVIVAIASIYYLSKFLYGTTGLQSTQLVSGKIPTNAAPQLVNAPPVIYEGGEFSVSFWVYIANWNVNNGTRKLIFTFGGNNYSTIVIGLGARTNTLFVRVATSTGDPNSQGQKLLTADVADLFQPNPPNEDVGSGSIGTQPMCDLPEIDLQRWVNITVVLNGRTCDVFLDGKLMRSCVLDNYFKVDNSSSLRANVLAFNNKLYGFDGYLSNLNMYNSAMNPSQIWSNYMKGPTGTNTDISSWFNNLINGSS